MFKVLELANFRGFEQARLAGLARINVFTGLNGSGKTSILEAAFLISGGANAGLAASLYGFRGESGFPIGSERIFRTLFRNLNPGTVPKIVASTSERLKTTSRYRRELSIKPTYAVSPGQATTSQPPALRGVTFEFVGPSGKETSKWGWTPEAHQLILQPNAPPQLLLGGKPSENRDLILAQYVSPYLRNVHPSPHDNLTRLVKERRADDVLEPLKLIHPQLKGLHPLTENDDKVIMADVGGESLLPISLLGSGVSNALHIVLPFVLHENATILIDEFEDGIHHSLLTPLLRIVLNLARVKRNQVFISTHSNEFIRHFIALANDEKATDIAFFRLGRIGLKGLVPRLSLSEAETLLDSNLDIR